MCVPLHPDFRFATPVHGIHQEMWKFLKHRGLQCNTRPQSGHNAGKIKPASDVHRVKVKTTEIYYVTFHLGRKTKRKRLFYTITSWLWESQTVSISIPGGTTRGQGVYKPPRPNHPQVVYTSCYASMKTPQEAMHYRFNSDDLFCL